MSFRIEQGDASIEDALRRIAAEQIGRALEEVDRNDMDFGHKVHRVRKRCKKLRGLIRLVRPGFAGYARENAAFRDAARLLSGVRNTRTLIETYDVVTAYFEEQIDRRAFASIRARLTRDARRTREAPDTEARMRAFRRAMQTAGERVTNWRLTERGFDAVAGGAGKTYERARRRMQAAQSTHDGESMHEWRKRVKYHWYHARLLRSVFPEMLAPQVALASALSDVLGDHHDLVVLDARLVETPNGFGRSADVEAFRALLQTRRDALAEGAFALGRKLLVERRTALVGRWRDYWELWNARPADTILTHA